MIRISFQHAVSGREWTSENLDMTVEQAKDKFEKELPSHIAHLFKEEITGNQIIIPSKLAQEMVISIIRLKND